MRLASLGLIFVLGLVAVDQGCRWIGDRLVAGGAIADDPYRDVAHRPDGTTVLVGDCRAEIVDGNAVSRWRGRPVVNAGGAAVGVGHMLFTVNVALSRGTGGETVLFLNDQILAATTEEIADELDRQWRWASHLAPERRAKLEKFLRPELRPFRASGLWRYRGSGLVLARAALRRALGRPPVRSHYVPNRIYGNATMAGREGQYEPARTWEASPAAIRALDELIDDSRAAGVPVTLVLSPMHERRMVAAVAEQVNDFAKELAKRHGVKLLSYLGNGTDWARRSDWWGNPGHLNNSGARVYSDALGRDLAGARQ